MKDFLQKLGLSMGSLFVAVLLFESLVWLAPDRWLPNRLRDLRDQLDRDAKSETLMVPDDELLFKLKAHSDLVVRHPDYTTRIVTHLNIGDTGFRGGSVGGPAWAVAVGDSFTFGAGVDDPDIWTSILARSLNKDVINLGVPAQGPVQYTRILKRYGLPLRPRVVFYGFYFNDLDSAVRFRGIRRGFQIKRYLRGHSIVYNLVQNRRRLKDAEPVLVKADGVELSLEPQGLQRNLERQVDKFEQRWQAVQREIDDASEASRAASMTFILCYFPSRWEVYWELIDRQLKLPHTFDIDRLHRRVIEYCGLRKIPCLDLTPALKSAASQNQQLYFRTDGHWNQAGHRVVARTMREFIDAKHL